MKKYRLIKEYPGSPQSGYILEQLKNNKNQNDNYYYNGIWLNPLKYPEFWEEIVEKDYEILEIRGKYGVIFSYNEELDNDLKDKTIFKIKRLSDGEIFTVGDRIQYYNITGEKSHTHVISDITIYENKILLNHNHGTWKSHGDFNKVQKIKQPLFKTEDGVDIFKNIDKYHTPIYIVDKALNIRYCEKDFNVKPSENVKYFFNKEKAEEYVLMNKPCLSIIDFVNLKFFLEDRIVMTKLKELVKRKIKQ